MEPTIRDTIWNGTPLGWAHYCGQPEIAAYLRTHGAPSRRVSSSPDQTDDLA
jgi:hypothetical protein